jgi:hypothetical protein
MDDNSLYRVQKEKSTLSGSLAIKAWRGCRRLTSMTAPDMMNKQPQTTENGWSSSLGGLRLKSLHDKKTTRYNMFHRASVLASSCKHGYEFSGSIKTGTATE